MGMNLYTAAELSASAALESSSKNADNSRLESAPDKDIACIRIKLKGICAVWELFIKDIR